MKIVDPDTGREYDELSIASDEYCWNTNCEDCPFGAGGCTMSDTCMDTPKKAIEMMDLKIVHDKPRLCEILGVEVGEKFKISGHNNVYVVNDDGDFVQEGSENTWSMLNGLCDLIENPEKIEYISCWTDKDITDAKAIKQLFPNVTAIRRVGKRGYILTDYHDCKKNGEWYVMLPDVIIPSLQYDKCTFLDDIIGSEEDGNENS